MRVLFITSEVAGMYKLGGLGDVSAALPKALARQGIEVTVALPFYTAIDPGRAGCIGTLAVPFNGNRETVFLFLSTLPGTNVPVYLFRHPKLEDYHAEKIVERFAFYSQTIVMFYLYTLTDRTLRFDILHCNDWHTALVPMLLGENNKAKKQKQTLQSRAVRTIITIHNLLYQGEIEHTILNKLMVPESQAHVLHRKGSSVVNLLREGLEYADIISTVSPTYAKEISTPEYSVGLGDVLHRRRDRVIGILNGIDMDIWNPDNDTILPLPYTEKNAGSVKKKIKKKLQKKLNLPEVDVPLFGFVGRLEPNQKGITLVLEAVEKLLPKTQFQLIILGTGVYETVRSIETLVRKFKKQIAFVHAFDEVLAHQIYAASDFFLVPSKFEPCGLIQMIAMRYGSVPVVRKTGGLADTVDDGKTGFVFDDYESNALAETMIRAISLFSTDPQNLQSIRSRGMTNDFSWKKSAAQYRKLYKSLLEKK